MGGASASQHVMLRNEALQIETSDIKKLKKIFSSAIADGTRFRVRASPEFDFIWDECWLRDDSPVPFCCSSCADMELVWKNRTRIMGFEFPSLLNLNFAQVTWNHIDEWPFISRLKFGEQPVNLVVVSNRVARAKANEPMTGGLAAALLPVVENPVRFGWAPAAVSATERRRISFRRSNRSALAPLRCSICRRRITVATMKALRSSALWPALHSRPDLIRVSNEDYKSYREVNAFMARALLRCRELGHRVLEFRITISSLGAELRELNVRQPIGFFLHTPWPASSVINGVPNHRELIGAMLAYDLIGFQTEDDC